jgi:hypothetical protein
MTHYFCILTPTEHKKVFTFVFLFVTGIVTNKAKKILLPMLLHNNSLPTKIPAHKIFPAKIRLNLLYMQHFVL